MIVIYVFRFRASFVSWFVVFIMGVMTFISLFLLNYHLEYVLFTSGIIFKKKTS